MILNYDMPVCENFYVLLYYLTKNQWIKNADIAKNAALISIESYYFDFSIHWNRIMNETRQYCVIMFAECAGDKLHWSTKRFLTEQSAGGCEF